MVSLDAGLIMKRILWPATKHARVASNGSKTKSVRRRVVESVIQSAAIYSVASISFGITSFLSPDIGFPICHSLFPPVIVSLFPLSSFFPLASPQNPMLTRGTCRAWCSC